MFNTYIDDLYNKYVIVGEPIFLSEEKSSIYNKLKSYYKPAFENNERIIVIQDCNDTYNYEDEPGESLIFLQESLQKIDISNCFVIIITGNIEIQQELKYVHKNFSSDNNMIEYQIIEYPYTKKIKNTDSFCVYPWIHLFIDSKGQMLPCCIADASLPMGTLTVNSVSEVFNNDRYKSLRLNMLSKKSCKECKVCNDQQLNNLESRRDRANKKWKYLINDLIKHTNTDGSINNFKIKTIDFRLSNVCNLMCRTCDGKSSNKIAHEEKVLFNNNTNFSFSLKSNERKEILNSNLKYIHDADEIYFAGGEPLVIDEHYQILDRLLEMEKINTELIYTSNLSFLKFKNKNVIDYWKKFNNLKINISIDGHGKILEYVRHGSSWNTIVKNIKNIKKECPHIKINIFSTISLLSIESIIELQQQWISEKFLLPMQFENNLLTNGNYSIQSLPLHHKKRTESIILNHINFLKKSSQSNLLINSWKYIISFMFLEDLSYTLPSVSKINQLRDKFRKEDFQQLYPQFIDLF